MKIILLLLLSAFLLAGCAQPADPNSCKSDSQCWNISKGSCNGYPRCNDGNCEYFCPTEPCKEQYRSWGICLTQLTQGYAYDPVSHSCRAGAGTGCMSYAPFSSIGECDQLCVDGNRQS